MGTKEEQGMDFNIITFTIYLKFPTCIQNAIHIPVFNFVIYMAVLTVTPI